jgi:signal transduction histidine kinase
MPQTHSSEQERLEAEMAMLARCVSHDLRQPLHVISGYVELVAFKYQATFDPKGKQLIGKALAGVERMNDMIDALVGLMRVDAHEPWREHIDVETMVDELLVVLRPEAEPLGARFTRTPLPTVSGRPALLVQVFEQLLRNVMRFPDEGEPRGHISARVEGDRVRFEVRDEGPGIDPRLHASVMEPFGRGQDPRAGSGMGLAICRKVVAIHGGAMGLESAPGEGSTFWFELPR